MITEYFPEYFEKLKEVYTDTVILNTLLSPYNYQKLINLIQETGGRSQAFLFLTSDHNFMLKTITKTERKYFINKMFPKYFERLKTDESKLVRILGVFKINSLKQSVVIMENILITKEKCVIFDLKGSRLSRLVKGIEDPESPQTGIVLKDENFLLFNKKLRLSQENKSKLIEALITDFNVLKECEVIDYSLLLGIYPKNFKQIKERNLMVDENGTKFSLGIIDIFQEYNFLKASEKKIKTILYKKEDISVATPLDYFERISEFILNIFE